VWLPGSGDVDVGAAQDFAQGEADVDVCAEVDAAHDARLATLFGQRVE
jgi:hypothetical protein